MVEDGALGVRSTRRGFARVHALVPQAGLVRVTVLVGAAAERAHVVQADMAQEAVVVQAAGQQAVAANAFLVQRALVVDRADRQANILATRVAIAAVLAAQAGHRYCK